MRRVRLMLSLIFALAGTNVSMAEDLTKWGFGVGLAMEFYGDAYVERASINGEERIVGIDEEFKESPAIWSALNWTATAPCEQMIAIVQYVCTPWVKPGWFVGAKLAGKDGVRLDGAAIGIQFAWLRTYTVRKTDGSEVRERRASLNLGVGYMIHSTQRLAPDIQEGQPLPAHYDDIRYRRSTDEGWMILISRDVQL